MLLWYRGSAGRLKAMGCHGLLLALCNGVCECAEEPQAQTFFAELGLAKFGSS